MGTLWIWIAFGLIFPTVCIVDWWLVKKGYTTISLRTWIAEQAHPTLIVGVYSIGLFLFFVTLSVPVVAFIIAVATGHLVTSEGASTALVTPSEYIKSPIKRAGRVPSKTGRV